MLYRSFLRRYKMQNLAAPNKYFLVFIALLIIPISGLAIDIYVPSLPAVSNYFGVDKALAQLSITAYMIGLGLMQLFAGSISDSFGRRNPFIYAMLIFILTTLLIPFTHDINQLLLLRLLQGSSVALTIVPMRSVILDLFEGRELQKMMTYTTMAWSIGPIIAPAIGGYLQHYLGWKANFYFLTIYSLFGFLLALFFLPETSQHRHVFKLKDILVRYLNILTHPEFFTGLLIDGLLYSVIILFSIVGPFLIQQVLHYSPIQFGRISLLMGLAWFLGTMGNRFLLDVPIVKKGNICLWLMFILANLIFILSLYLPLNIYSIVIPIICMLFFGGIVFPNYFATSLSLFPRATGSANALFGAFIFLIAGMSSALATFLKSTSEVPLACAYIIAISLCLICFYVNIAIKSEY